jgi:hypothetical protein
MLRLLEALAALIAVGGAVWWASQRIVAMRRQGRATDADRDRALAELREARVRGELDEVEYDERVDAVLRARTRADLERASRLD